MTDTPARPCTFPPFSSPYRGACWWQIGVQVRHVETTASLLGTHRMLQMTRACAECGLVRTTRVSRLEPGKTGGLERVLASPTRRDLLRRFPHSTLHPWHGYHSASCRRGNGHEDSKPLVPGHLDTRQPCWGSHSRCVRNVSHLKVHALSATAPDISDTAN